MASLDSGVGIGQSVQGAADPGLDIGQVLVLGDLDGRQVVDHVFDLLLVERPTAGDAPGRHRGVAPAVGDPEIDLVLFVSEEDVVERWGRPLDRDTRPLLDIWGDTTRSLRAVTVETAELLDEVRATLDRALGELLDEALLSLLLGEEVERERNGEECGEGDGRLLPALQPPGLDLLVVDAWSKIGSDLLTTPVADRRDEEHAQPGDPCDQGDDRDDVGGHASATALMQLGPCGYWTSNTGARGVWMMVPVRMMRLPPWFSTTNRSRLRGAGPPKYWPMALYLDP